MKKIYKILRLIKYEINHIILVHKRSNLKLNKFKLSNKDMKGDTFFILGCGESINNLSANDFNKIKNNCSIGLNYWLIHEFVPDFYMFEFPREKDRLANYISWFKRKRFSYLNVKKIARYTCLDKIQLNNEDFQDVSYLKEYPIVAKNVKDLNDELSKLEIKNNKFPSYKASIITALFIGLKLGYKKIVFCGVDLNNTNYFYDNYKLDDLPSNIQIDKIHKTLLKGNEGLNVIDVISIIKKTILDKNNINIYTSNNKSELRKVIDVYNFN